MQIKNRMNVEIYKKDDKFYLIPAPAVAGVLNNRQCECGYVYELDLDTGEFWMSDWFEEPVGKIWDLERYERVGWAEINKVEKWYIAPLALDKERVAAGDYSLTKDFAKEDDD